MKQRKDKDWLNCRVFIATACVGLFFSAIFIAYLKKNNIYNHDYEFGRIITILFVAAFVVLPLACCIILLLFDYVLIPLLHQMLHYVEQCKIRKYGHKEWQRKQRYKRRVNKITGPYMVGYIIITAVCIHLLTFILFVLTHNIFEIDLKEFPPNYLIITFFLAPLFLSFYLCANIIVRLFIKHKGKAKALKYLIELKKKPGFFAKCWLRMYGFSQQDIRIYLEKHKEYSHKSYHQTPHGS